MVAEAGLGYGQLAAGSPVLGGPGGGVLGAYGDEPGKDYWIDRSVANCATSGSRSCAAWGRHSASSNGASAKATASLPTQRSPRSATCSGCMGKPSHTAVEHCVHDLQSPATPDGLPVPSTWTHPGEKGGSRSAKSPRPVSDHVGHRQRPNRVEQPGDLAPFRGAHAADDLGVRHDADHELAGPSAGTPQPVPRGADPARVRDKHIRIEEEHNRLWRLIYLSPSLFLGGSSPAGSGTRAQGRDDRAKDPRCHPRRRPR